MAKVGIVMGSDSDMPVMSKAADILEQFGVEYEMTIISAHREPDVFFEYAKSAEEKAQKRLNKIMYSGEFSGSMDEYNQAVADAKENAKKIIAAIKATKLKVNTQMQGEQVRVSGAKKDDLQAVIQTLKAGDFGIDLQFINMR